MKNTLKKQNGFTLVELLIFMGIFSILVLSMFQLLISIFDVQLESQSTSVVSQDSRFILNRLSYDIKNAESVTTPIIGNQGQTLVISDQSAVYTYSLSGGNLTLTNSVTGATDNLNSINTTISNLAFLRLSDINNENNTITVSFTINSKTEKRSGEVAQDFRITLGTR